MKFEEKRKKNKNCEISHIVRPTMTPEVYNQRQNALSISKCVEHKMLKVTWAKLCVYSDGCTTKCTFWAQGSGGRTARRFLTLGSNIRYARLGWSWCTSWSGCVCSWTCPRFGRDTRIGCARAKLLWMIEPCG